MDFVRRKKWIWKVIIIAASLALIVSSFLPYMLL